MNSLVKQQRRILVLCAVGNFLGALIALISPSFFFSQFFKYPPLAGDTFPYLPVYHYTFWSFVLVMGFGYLMAAYQPGKQRAIILVGGLGKLIAAIFWLMLWLQGQGSWLMIGGAGWDGIFGMMLLLMMLAKNTTGTSVEP